VVLVPIHRRGQGWTRRQWKKGLWGNSFYLGSGTERKTGAQVRAKIVNRRCNGVVNSILSFCFGQLLTKKMGTRKTILLFCYSNFPLNFLAHTHFSSNRDVLSKMWSTFCVCAQGFPDFYVPSIFRDHLVISRFCY
jgi:hypothetical protein